ncbi:MAG: hypothetical protein JWN96_2431 [Mycobacterium sp.]|jgi:hypothetical protein|nr:hypothetical protein [Mycobacterium sp.]
MSTFRVVQYTTHQEAVAENTRLVAAVYDELEHQSPEAFRYATLLLNDDTFLHLAVTTDQPAPLPDLPAFQTFQRGLGARVSAPPTFSEARIVGNYRLL